VYDKRHRIGTQIDRIGYPRLYWHETRAPRGFQAQNLQQNCNTRGS
jgi:hypothetical protein